MKWLPWALLVGVALWLLAQLAIEAHLRQALAANGTHLAAITAQRDSARWALAHRIPEVDSLIDTVWRPARLRVDTLRDSVPVPVEVVREIVRAADTTIRACRATLSACEGVAALERARADTLANRVALLTRAQQGVALRLQAFGATDLRGHLYAGVMGTWRLPLLPITGYGQAESRLDSVAVGVRVGVAVPLRF